MNLLKKYKNKLSHPIECILALSMLPLLLLTYIVTSVLMTVALGIVSILLILPRKIQYGKN
jgi:hypothetical protein